MPATPLRFIRQDIQSMHAYAIQASDGMVKLDAMENPFTLPAPLQAALGQRLGAVAVNRYPGQRIEDLKQALAQHIMVHPFCPRRGAQRFQQEPTGHEANSQHQ